MSNGTGALPDDPTPEPERAFYSYTYGGKGGDGQSLEISDDRIVVRTREVAELMDAVQSEENRQIVRESSTVAEFPDANVHVLELPAAADEAVARRNHARRSLRQEDQIRFAGRVLQDPESKTPVVYTENLFVQFHAHVPADECRAILRQHNLTVKDRMEYAENAYFVAAPEGTGLSIFQIAEELLARPEVELCHPELVRPVSRRTIFPRQWHLALADFDGVAVDAHINLEEAWATTRGANITIAVIDDGVDIDHEEFAIPGKIVHPRDVTAGVDDPRPKINAPHPFPDDHGTACAGVACAGGLHQATGVAPEARLMPIRLRSGLGSKAEADAFYWAARKGADVISCSWGPADGHWANPHDARHFQRTALPDMTRTAIDYALQKGRRGKGCVIVWAAGNGRESVDNDGYASYEPVIAVAACNDQNRRSVYSDFGNAIWVCFPSDDREWPDLMQPAPLTAGIWTTDRSGADGYNPGRRDPWATPGDDLGHYTDRFGGTSSACPGVAGVVALMLAANPDLRREEVKEILRHATAQIDRAGGSYDLDGHSPFYGYGRVDAGAAVRLAVELEDRSVHLADDRPVFDALVFEVEPGPRYTPAEMARQVADEVLGKTTWRLSPVPASETAFDAVYTGRGRMTTARAWELTYALRAHRAVLWAEPSFVAPLPGFTDLDQEDVRRMRAAVPRAAVFAVEHHPDTETNFIWSVQQVAAPEAWDLPPQGASRGEGVRIGHPDSGYRLHPELDADRVLVDLARDFLDNDAIAEDVGGNHGLGTASVIISGANTNNGQPVVTGIAPRAQILPLRVTEARGFVPAPVLLTAGMRRLRDAIHYAVDQDCHVISMSLGGPFPHRSLQDAIRRAVDNGVIVLAAAGNMVRFVVWPAAFPEVIAVAACNIERAPWVHSSLGRAVDITAPGESVWKATVQQDGGTRVVREHGTSFAVATAAGIAALWLAHHGREQLISLYGKPGIAPVFREILATHGADPSPLLPPGKFGAGIINARKVLQAPLPATPPAGGMHRFAPPPLVTGSDEMARIVSLFEDVPVAETRGGLGALFERDETELAQTLDVVGDELAFHLMTDARARRQFRNALEERAAPRVARRNGSAPPESLENLRRRWSNADLSSPLAAALE